MRTWAFRVAFAALRGFVPPQGARGASAQLFKHRAVRTVGGFIIALLASCFAALSHAVAAHTPSLLALFVSVLTATPLAIAAVGKKHSFFCAQQCSSSHSGGFSLGFCVADSGTYYRSTPCTHFTYCPQHS